MTQRRSTDRRRIRRPRRHEALRCCRSCKSAVYDQSGHTPRFYTSGNRWAVHPDRPRRRTARWPPKSESNGRPSFLMSGRELKWTPRADGIRKPRGGDDARSRRRTGRGSLPLELQRAPVLLGSSSAGPWPPRRGPAFCSWTAAAYALPSRVRSSSAPTCRACCWRQRAASRTAPGASRSSSSGRSITCTGWFGNRTDGDDVDPAPRGERLGGHRGRGHLPQTRTERLARPRTSSASRAW